MDRSGGGFALVSTKTLKVSKIKQLSGARAGVEPAVHLGKHNKNKQLTIVVGDEATWETLSVVTSPVGVCSC